MNSRTMPKESRRHLEGISKRSRRTVEETSKRTRRTLEGPSKKRLEEQSSSAGKGALGGDCIRARSNLTYKGSSGKIGDQFVARKWKGIYIIAAAPNFPESREFTEGQIAQQNRFREAVYYSRAMLADPEMAALYESEAEGKDLTPYNAAVRDYLKPPRLLEVDLSGYTGAPGEQIRVKAVDDVLVKSVTVAIIVDGEILEQGEASQDGVNKLLWVYTTREASDASCLVRVTATDLPGNQVVGEAEA